jgi:hypothetical protein
MHRLFSQAQMIKCCSLNERWVCTSEWWWHNPDCLSESHDIQKDGRRYPSGIQTEVCDNSLINVRNIVKYRRRYLARIIERVVLAHPSHKSTAIRNLLVFRSVTYYFNVKNPVLSLYPKNPVFALHRPIFQMQCLYLYYSALARTISE